MQLTTRFISVSLPLIIVLVTAINVVADPLLEIDEPVFNFGTCDSACIITNTFVLKNIGDKPLIITETKESCGCTVSELETKQILPGHSADLTIRMTLKGMDGPVKKFVHIISNNPEHVKTVTIEGTALARVSLLPPSLSMGRIDPQNPPVPSKVCLSGYNTNAVIKNVHCSTNLFKVTVSDDARSLTVYPPVDQAPGASKQSVIVMTSDEKSPKLVLNVFAYTTPPIRYVPATVYVPKDEKDAKRYVMLRPGSAGEFKLSEAKLSSPFASVDIDARPKSSYHVILSHINTALITPQSTLTLVTDIPDQPEIIIPVKLLDQ